MSASTLPDLTMKKGECREVYLNLARFAKVGPRTMKAILGCAKWSSHLRAINADIDDGNLRVQEALPRTIGPDKVEVWVSPLLVERASFDYMAEMVTVSDLTANDGTTPLRFREADLPKVDGDEKEMETKRKELAAIVAGLGPLFVYE